MLDRLSLERRQRVPLPARIASYVCAVLVACALALAILVYAGVPTDALFQELVVQVFFASAGLAQTITIAIPMVLVGLSAALCFKLKFWNIGIEGQLLLGGIFATTVALFDIGGPLRLPVMLLASAIGGLLWIAIPVLLKLKLRVSEVIVSLLLTNIAFLLLQHLLFGALGDPTKNFPTSPVFDDVERLAKIGYGGVHSGVLLALLLALAIALALARTRFGFAVRLISDNPDAARALGFRVAKVSAITLLAGGALAGLAGGVVVTGTEFRLSQYIGLHATFNGIVVAALALNAPLWIPVAAFFLAGLNVASASLKVFYGVSEGFVLVIQGCVLLTLVTSQFFTTYKMRLRPRG